MFIAALFIIARIWKQPRCLSADEWIRKLWYIYTMDYYSAIKNKILQFVTWVDLEGTMLSELRPGLDETQLGLRQRELGHVLVGFQDPWSELQDQAGEGLPRSLRPPACPYQGDRMWSLRWGQCPAWGHWSAPCLHSAA